MSDREPVCGGGCVPAAANLPQITSPNCVEGTARRTHLTQRNSPRTALWLCGRCSTFCGRKTVWLARAWRILVPLAWLRALLAQMPLALQRSFCIDWAITWEATAVAYTPPGRLTSQGDAVV